MPPFIAETAEYPPEIQDFWGSTRLPQMSDVPAVIMAGGYGTRLKELTRDIPKPMVPVAGRPALDHVVDHLENHGVKNAAMALHYLPHKIRDHFGDGRGNRIRFHYNVAREDFGTAGGVLRASRLVDGSPLLVVSGDVLTDIDLNEMLRFHHERKSPLTVALTRVEDATQYGVAITDHKGRIMRFVEKPKTSPPGGAWINAGIYLLDRSVLENVPRDLPFDFSRNLIPMLMAQGVPIYGSRHSGTWFDIGTPTTLREAERHLAEQSCRGERGAACACNGGCSGSCSE